MEWFNRIKRLFGRGPTEWGLRIARDKQRTELFLAKYLKPEFNAIDIGAHEGEFLKLFLRYAPHGRHRAFEPLPEYAEKLKMEFAGVDVQQVALSNETGEVVFYRAVGAEAMSGLKSQHYPGHVTPQPFTVRVFPLDDLVPAEEPIHFIKIDVEGAELNVLKGAKRILKKSRPAVMFEFAKLHAAPYQVTPADLFAFFEDMNYRVLRLDGGVAYTLADFEENFHKAHQSGYDRHAETNFLALPAEQILNG
ncbi:MAG: hypothetical protein KatS3mg032_1015 [Cyclobacteriaceae bacterium]|nr:MAG: hypothetical protein KatS3mg032_1015 [Cyclobacteriaceae bacterium]